MFGGVLMPVSRILAISVLASTCSMARAAARRVVSLNGTWQIAEGSMDRQPEQFEHEVAVPGLVDMAKPAFAEVGRKSDRRQAFWYRRTFALDGSVPAVARLKIRKASFGTRVWINGQLAGEHLPCFTPGEFDVQRFLKTAGQNEVI